MANQIAKQILLIWQKYTVLQKVIVSAVLCIVLLFVYFSTQRNPLVPLFPEALNSAAAKQLRGRLKEEGIAYKEETKGIFLVPEAKVSSLRLKFQESPIKGNKGFEIFDSNTWIKGEKELQMLEWRALKGQLEKEIEKFENVKSASVILDFGNFKQNRGNVEKPKVSCILTLVPETHLTSSCLTAITSHLVSAVRGLEGSQVAISDTSGKLYKRHGVEGVDEKVIVAERIKSELTKLFRTAVGEPHFEISQTKNGLAIALDHHHVSPLLKGELLKQCGQIIGNEFPYSLELLPFQNTKPSPEKKKITFPPIFYLSPLLALALLPLFIQKKHKKKRNHEEIQSMIQKIDIDKLVATIKKEEPSTIALFLSYLDPTRAEKVITSLPDKIQEEVYVHLSEIEKQHV